MRNEIIYGLFCLLILNAVFQGGEGAILRSLSPLLLLLLLFFFLFFKVQNKPLQIQRNPLHLPLFLVALSLILSTFFSPSWGNSLRGLSLELAYLAIAFLGIQLFSSKKSAERVGIFLILLALFEAFFAIGQRLFLGMERVTGTFRYATFFIDPLLVGLSFLLGFLLFDPLKRWQKILLLSALPFFLLAFLLSGTRAVLLSLLSILLFLGFLKGRKVLSLLLLVALLILIFALLLPNPLQERLLHGERNIYAFQRPRIWLTSIHVIRDHPLFGVGLRNFELLSPPYNFPVENAVGRYAKKVEIPHNQYLLVASHSGVLGLLSFFLLLIFSMNSGIKLRSHGGVYAGALVGVIAFLVHFLVDNPLYLPVNGFTFYLLLGLLGSRFQDSKIHTLNRVRARLYLFLLFVPLAYLLSKPLAATLIYRQGVEEAKKKNYQKAIRASRAASILLPSESLYQNAQGALYSKYFEETQNPLHLQLAYKEFKTAIVTHPILPFYREDFADFLYAHREELEKMGINVDDEIFHQIHTAISLDPYNPFYRRKLAIHHANLGEKKKATQVLEETLTIEPHYLLVRYQLILFYRELGEQENVVKHYRILLSHLDQNLQQRVQTPYEKDLVAFDKDLLMDLPFLDSRE